VVQLWREEIHYSKRLILALISEVFNGIACFMCRYSDNQSHEKSLTPKRPRQNLTIPSSVTYFRNFFFFSGSEATPAKKVALYSCCKAERCWDITGVCWTRRKYIATCSKEIFYTQYWKILAHRSTRYHTNVYFLLTFKYWAHRAAFCQKSIQTEHMGNIHEVYIVECFLFL
jgi:hypothetical protein